MHNIIPRSVNGYKKHKVGKGDRWGRRSYFIWWTEMASLKWHLSRCLNKWGKKKMSISLPLISIDSVKSNLFCSLLIIAAIYFCPFCARKFAYIISCYPTNRLTILLYYHLQRRKWKLWVVKTMLVIARTKIPTQVILRPLEHAAFHGFS